MCVNGVHQKKASEDMIGGTVNAAQGKGRGESLRLCTRGEPRWACRGDRGCEHSYLHGRVCRLGGQAAGESPQESSLRSEDERVWGSKAGAGRQVTLVLRANG